MGSYFASPFSGGNLFLTICILLMIFISLPSLMLDRIIRLFEIHRRIRPRDLKAVEVQAGQRLEAVADARLREEILGDYAAAKFVQKTGAVNADPPEPRIVLETGAGERVVAFWTGLEVNITRFDRRGRAAVTYWVRGGGLADRLRALAVLEAAGAPHSSVSPAPSASR